MTPVIHMKNVSKPQLVEEFNKPNPPLMCIINDFYGRIPCGGSPIFGASLDGEVIVLKTSGSEFRAPAWINSYHAPSADLYYTKEAARDRISSGMGLKTQIRYHNTVGSDPEAFVVHKDSGHLIPAFFWLGGKKGQDPGPYWDGFQAEFAPFANVCMDVHRENIADCMATLESKAKEVGGVISTKNVFEIDKELLREGPPQLVNFGCKPSFNVYDEPSPIANVDPRSVPIRSAGGHMHFSLNEKSKSLIGPIVKALDAIVGLSAVSLFQYYDDPRRRNYYGRAGEFRVTPYGIEYRVLSNAWLVHPLAYNLLFEMARYAMGEIIFEGGKLLSVPWQAEEDETRRIINDCDVEGAKKVIERNEPWFKSTLGNYFHHEEIMALITNGLDKYLHNPDGFTNFRDAPKYRLYEAFSLDYTHLKLGTKIDIPSVKK